MKIKDNRMDPFEKKAQEQSEQEICLEFIRSLREETIPKLANEINAVEKAAKLNNKADIYYMKLTQGLSYLNTDINGGLARCSWQRNDAKGRMKG